MGSDGGSGYPQAMGLDLLEGRHEVQGWEVVRDILEFSVEREVHSRLLVPWSLFWVRWRAETQYKYNVFIADKSVEPDCSQNLWSSWKNGASFYFPAMATVKDLKDSVYQGVDVPKTVRAGCYGRMMEDTDNLALAVRTFCKRDPKIVLWEEAE